MASPQDVFAEYLGVVWGIVGTFHDAAGGFARARLDLVEQQKRLIVEFAETSPECASIDYLDARRFAYADAPPTDPNMRLFHESTQAEFKERTGPGGRNHIFIGNMSLIAIYQYWDDHYRGKLAIALNKRTDDVKADIFGDLRQLRISIVHHGGIALPRVAEARILRWFATGDLILIEDAKLQTIEIELRKVPALLGF